MRYRVRHTSTLAYAAPVANAQFNLRLVPRPWPNQRVIEQALELTPEPAMRRDMAGPYWVNTTQVGFDAPLSTFEIASSFTMDVTPLPVPQFGPPVAQVRNEALAQRDLSELSPAPYLFGSRIAALDETIGGWGAGHFAPDTDILAAARAIMQAVFGEFAFQPGSTDTRTPPEQAFAARRGVCQDFTHVMIIALRAAGIPAAYVSGYLLTLPPPGKPKLVGADAMHAWVAVWCGRELGWVGFDPTNDRLAGEDHIAIGMGRDYADVSPVNGTFIGSAPQSLKTGVDVELVEPSGP
jgi:transglutaminase-like putative cysteine protease